MGIRSRLLIPLLACMPIISTAQDSLKGKVAYVKETTWFVTTDGIPIKENPVYNERVRTWNRNQQLLTSKEIRHHIEGLNDSGWASEENCIYNKDGQLVERTLSDVFLQHSRLIKKYDSHRRLAKESWQAKYRFGDFRWDSVEHIYNEAGTKTEVRTVSNENTYPRSIQYFSGSERLDSVVSFGKDGRLLGCNHFVYDASGREIERSYAWPGRVGVERYYSCTYNEKGQKVEESSVIGRFVYKYDDKGNEVEVLRYYDDGNLRKSVTKTYNANGYLIKVVTSERNARDEMEFAEETEYTNFDKEGNPLKKTERRLNTWKPQTFVTVYQIEYNN